MDNVEYQLPDALRQQVTKLLQRSADVLNDRTLHLSEKEREKITHEAEKADRNFTALDTADFEPEHAILLAVDNFLSHFDDILHRPEDDITRIAGKAPKDIEIHPNFVRTILDFMYSNQFKPEYKEYLEEARDLFAAFGEFETQTWTRVIEKPDTPEIRLWKADAHDTTDTLESVETPAFTGGTPAVIYFEPIGAFLPDKEEEKKVLLNETRKTLIAIEHLLDPIEPSHRPDMYCVTCRGIPITRKIGEILAYNADPSHYFDESARIFAKKFIQAYVPDISDKEGSARDTVLQQVEAQFNQITFIGFSSGTVSMKKAINAIAHLMTHDLGYSQQEAGQLMPHIHGFGFAPVHRIAPRNVDITQVNMVLSGDKVVDARTNTLGLNPTGDKPLSYSHANGEIVLFSNNTFERKAIALTPEFLEAHPPETLSLRKLMQFSEQRRPLNDIQIETKRLRDDTQHDFYTYMSTEGYRAVRHMFCMNNNPGVCAMQDMLAESVRSGMSGSRDAPALQDAFDEKMEHTIERATSRYTTSVRQFEAIEDNFRLKSWAREEGRKAEGLKKASELSWDDISDDPVFLSRVAPRLKNMGHFTVSDVESTKMLFSALAEETTLDEMENLLKYLDASRYLSEHTELLATTILLMATFPETGTRKQERWEEIGNNTLLFLLENAKSDASLEEPTARFINRIAENTPDFMDSSYTAASYFAVYQYAESPGELLLEWYKEADINEFIKETTDIGSIFKTVQALTSEFEAMHAFKRRLDEGHDIEIG